MITKIKIKDFKIIIEISMLDNRLNNPGLIYQKFTPSGCKDIWIRNLSFWQLPIFILLNATFH